MEEQKIKRYKILAVHILLQSLDDLYHNEEDMKYFYSDDCKYLCENIDVSHNYFLEIARKIENKEIKIKKYRKKIEHHILSSV